MTPRSETTQGDETARNSQEPDAKSDAKGEVDDTFQGLATPKIILLMLSSLFSMMLVALDRTIVTTVRKLSLEDPTQRHKY